MKKRKVFGVLVAVIALSIVFTSGVAFGTLLEVEEVASMTVAHIGGGVTSYNGKLYVWTGYTNSGPRHYDRTAKMEIYDPQTDTWSEGAAIPQAKSMPVSYELNGKFYTVGGETNPSGSFTNTVHRYQPSTDTWVQMNSFDRTIWQGHSVVANGKAYVFGGASGYGTPSSSLHEYNEAGDSWISKTSMPTGVSYPAATSYDDKVWVFGGPQSYHPTVITDEVQIYNPETDSWTHGDSIPWKLVYSEAVTYENEIWLFARLVYDEDLGDWIDNEYAYRYSPVTSDWARFSFELPDPMSANYDSPLGLIGDYVYFTSNYENDTRSPRVFRTQIPEPATLLLFGLGGLALRKKRRA